MPKPCTEENVREIAQLTADACAEVHRIMTDVTSLMAHLEQADVERFTKGVTLIRTEAVEPLEAFSDRMRSFQQDWQSLSPADLDQRWAALTVEAPSVIMQAVTGVQSLSGMIDRHLARRNQRQQQQQQLDRVLFRAQQRQRCCVIS